MKKTFTTLIAIVILSGSQPADAFWFKKKPKLQKSPIATTPQVSKAERASIWAKELQASISAFKSAEDYAAQLEAVDFMEDTIDVSPNPKSRELALRSTCFAAALIGEKNILERFKCADGPLKEILGH